MTTSAGERLHTDLVIDAMGRRTPTADWLADLGARKPYVESEDCGFAEMDALRDGREPPVRDSPMARFAAAAGTDADLFRGVIEITRCMALPEEVLNRPGIRDKVDAWDPDSAPRPPGPNRDQLLRLLSA